MKKAAFLILVSIFSVLVFADGKKSNPKRDYVPYRGMRMATEKSDFCVRSIRARKNSNGENTLMEILIRFSMPVDPRSINADAVLLNGKKCGSNVFFNFGRKGESVRITIVNPEEENYSLQFNGAESYKADVLVRNKFENIQDGTELPKGRH